MEALSNGLWDEWITLPVSETRLANSEISGILGSLSEEHRQSMVFLNSNRLWIFRRLWRLWPASQWSGSMDLASMLKIPLNRRKKVSLIIPNDIYNSIIKVSSQSLLDQLSWSWLRGALGSVGSLYSPKSGYYMAFRFFNSERENQIVSILRTNKFHYSCRERLRTTEVILRNQQEIVTLLSKLQLVETSLRLEGRAIVRAMRDRANRLVNCDASNIRKSLEAAQRQMEIARKIVEGGYLSQLSDDLSELVILRMDNPSATLNELGQSMSKPVSKSTVKYRWKKLQMLVESLLL